RRRGNLLFLDRRNLGGLGRLGVLVAGEHFVRGGFGRVVVVFELDLLVVLFFLLLIVGRCGRGSGGLDELCLLRPLQQHGRLGRLIFLVLIILHDAGSGLGRL